MIHITAKRSFDKPSGWLWGNNFNVSKVLSGGLVSGSPDTFLKEPWHEYYVWEYNPDASTLPGCQDKFRAYGIPVDCTWSAMFLPQSHHWDYIEDIWF